MIRRVDATLENLHAVLEKYGYADVTTRYLGTIQPYVPDGWAGIKLIVVSDTRTPHGDPWAVRGWGLDKVKQCLAELQAHGWYLHSRLGIDQRSHVSGGTWTLHGDCVEEPSEWGIITEASFEVYGFPPLAKR